MFVTVDVELDGESQRAFCLESTESPISLLVSIGVQFQKRLASCCPYT
jgi:hypothetical protein